MMSKRTYRGYLLGIYRLLIFAKNYMPNPDVRQFAMDKKYARTFTPNFVQKMVITFREFQTKNQPVFFRIFRNLGQGGFFS